MGRRKKPTVATSVTAITIKSAVFAQCIGLCPFRLQRLRSLPAFFEHPDGDRIEDQRAMAVPLGAFDPAHGVSIRSGTQLAAGNATQVVGDDIVVANAATLAVNAVEKLNEFDDFDIKPGFLLYFARNSVEQRLTHLEHSAGECPMALERFPATADEQHAALVNDDRAHADQRSLGKLSLNAFIHA